jgi:hypothetical protein
MQHLEHSFGTYMLQSDVSNPSIGRENNEEERVKTTAKARLSSFAALP